MGKLRLIMRIDMPESKMAVRQEQRRSRCCVACGRRLLDPAYLRPGFNGIMRHVCPRPERTEYNFPATQAGGRSYNTRLAEGFDMLDD